MTIWERKFKIKTAIEKANQDTRINMAEVLSHAGHSEAMLNNFLATGNGDTNAIWKLEQSLRDVGMYVDETEFERRNRFAGIIANANESGMEIPSSWNEKDPHEILLASTHTSIGLGEFIELLRLAFTSTSRVDFDPLKILSHIYAEMCELRDSADDPCVEFGQLDEHLHSE